MLIFGYLAALAVAVTRGWLQDLVGGEKDRTCSWVGCKHMREGS